MVNPFLTENNQEGNFNQWNNKTSLAGVAYWTISNQNCGLISKIIIFIFRKVEKCLKIPLKYERIMTRSMDHGSWSGLILEIKNKTYFRLRSLVTENEVKCCRYFKFFFSFMQDIYLVIFFDDGKPTATSEPLQKKEIKGILKNSSQPKPQPPPTVVTPTPQANTTIKTGNFIFGKIKRVYKRIHKKSYLNFYACFFSGNVPVRKVTPGQSSSESPPDQTLLKFRVVVRLGVRFWVMVRVIIFRVLTLIRWLHQGDSPGVLPRGIHLEQKSTIPKKLTFFFVYVIISS